MTVQVATSYAEAEKLLSEEKNKKVELAFNINADDFFKLLAAYGGSGNRIIKEKEYFRIIKSGVISR